MEATQDDRYPISRKHMLMMFKLKAEEQWIRYLLSLSEFSDKSAESQIHSFIDMPLQTNFIELDCIFEEMSDLSESDDSELNEISISPNSYPPPMLRVYSNHFVYFSLSVCA